MFFRQINPNNYFGLVSTLFIGDELGLAPTVGKISEYCGGGASSSGSSTSIIDTIVQLLCLALVARTTGVPRGILNL